MKFCIMLRIPFQSNFLRKKLCNLVLKKIFASFWSLFLHRPCVGVFRTEYC